MIAMTEALLSALSAFCQQLMKRYSGSFSVSSHGRRKICEPALLMLLCSRYVHAHLKAGPRSVSRLWLRPCDVGSTPQRVGRHMNHRALSRTLGVASIALAFSSAFLCSDACRAPVASGSSIRLNLESAGDQELCRHLGLEIYNPF